MRESDQYIGKLRVAYSLYTTNAMLKKPWLGCQSRVFNLETADDHITNVEDDGVHGATKILLPMAVEKAASLYKRFGPHASAVFPTS